MAMALTVDQRGVLRRIARLLVSIVCAAIPLGSLSVAKAQIWWSNRMDSKLPSPLEFTCPLVEGRDGMFYGAAADNQADPNVGGALFRLDGHGRLHILHRFRPNDGLEPETTPVAADDGCLYGSTLFGGENLLGTIYRFDPRSNGFSKIADVPMDFLQGTVLRCAGSDGALYGTCSRLNESEQGAIFRCTRRGELSLFHVLTASDDTTLGDAPPGNPICLIASSDGNFYGLVQSGGPLYHNPDAIFPRTSVPYSSSPPLEISPSWRPSIQRLALPHS